MNFTTSAAENDGLPCLEVGSWVEEKYRWLHSTTSLFSTGMKYRWHKRVYIDLYAGPGYSRVIGSTQTLQGSPLLALEVPDRFDKYIFCESNPAYMDALRQRVERLFPDTDVQFVAGDCNENISEICRAIPSPSKEQKVLSFCFVDPFDLSTGISILSFPFTRKPMPLALSCQPQTALASLRW